MTGLAFLGGLLAGLALAVLAVRRPRPAPPQSSNTPLLVRHKYPNMWER